MTWTQQLLHVLRRDLRHFRWYVAAYAITVVLLVARVYRAEPTVVSFNVSLLLLLIGLGMFLVAVAVQADPPTADDAMWRATPLAPSAVLAAKLALAVLLLVIGLAGQFAALQAFAVGPTDMTAYLLQSIVPMCWWLMGSMMIAAHTRDARWYLTVLITAPIALAILLWFVNFGMMFGVPRLVENANDPAALFGFLRFVALVVATVVLALSYTRRIGRRVSSVAAAAMVMLGGLVGAATSMVTNARTTSGVRLRTPDLRVQASLAIDVSDQESSTVSIRLTGAEVSATDRLLVEWPVMFLRFPDSSEVRLQLSTGMRASFEETEFGQTTNFGQGWQGMVMAEPAQVAATGATWPAQRFREHRFTILSTLTDGQRRAIDSGRVEAWIEANAQLLQAHEVIQASSTAGARSTVPGLRLSIAEYRRRDLRGQRVDRVAHLSIVRLGRDLMDDHDGASLVAVLLGRESRVLFQRMSSFDDNLVLPGVSRSNSSFSLAPERRSDESMRMLPGWIDSARVVVLRWENPRAARLTSDPVRLVAATIPAVRGNGLSARAAVSVPIND
jgi:hypothetical protein